MRRLQERGSFPPLSPLAARRLALAGAVAGVVVTADQLSKAWALRALVDGPIHVAWTLRLNLSFNTGAAFGLAPGLGPVLVVVGVVLVLALLAMAPTAASLPGAAALGLVLGGALGNLGDRLLRRGGAVVDFIDLQWWPVFNVADMAITGGAALLALTAWRDPGLDEPSDESTAAPAR